MEEPDRDFKKSIAQYKAEADNKAQIRRDTLDALRAQADLVRDKTSLAKEKGKTARIQREIEKEESQDFAKGEAFDVFSSVINLDDANTIEAVWASMPKITKEATNFIFARLQKDKEGNRFLPETHKKKVRDLFTKYAAGIRYEWDKANNRKEKEAEEKILNLKQKRKVAQKKSQVQATKEARAEAKALQGKAKFVKDRLGPKIKLLGSIHGSVINRGYNSVSGKKILPAELGNQSQREKILSDPIYIQIKKDKKGAVFFKAQQILGSMYGLDKYYTYSKLKKLSDSSGYQQFGQINYNGDPTSLQSVFWLNPNKETRDNYRDKNNRYTQSAINIMMPEGDEAIAKNTISLLRELQLSFPGEPAHKILDSLSILGGEGLWGNKTIQQVLELYPEYTQRTELAAPMTRTSTLPQTRTSTAGE
jgi:hypothetical protein